MPTLGPAARPGRPQIGESAGRSASTRLSDLGEDGLVARAIGAYPAPPAWVTVPPGDDAAVLDLPGPTVVSTDTVVEGEDFRRHWSSGADVGVKVAAQNLADVAAMGAHPRALLVSVAAPGEADADWIGGIAVGLAAECARAGASVVGGDVSAAPVVVITGTALGVLRTTPVLRSGARPGDLVAVAGVLGRSAAGLALLEAGRPELDPGLVRAHLAPQPPYDAGPAAAAAGATAMIDTSDGLLRDAGRIAAASRMVLDLHPPEPDADLGAAAEALGVDARQWVLTGGEDHALLACFPAGTALPEPYREIGAVLAPSEALGARVLVDGHEQGGNDGWHHFR